MKTLLLVALAALAAAEPCVNNDLVCENGGECVRGASYSTSYMGKVWNNNMFSGDGGWESKLLYRTSYQESTCTCPPAYHGVKCETAWPTAEPTAAPTDYPTSPPTSPQTGAPTSAPTSQPTCADTPPSTAAASSRLKMESSAGIMNMELLDDGTVSPLPPQS